MEHKDAMKKLVALHKQLGGMDELRDYITSRDIFKEWHTTDYGLAVRTTGSEYDGIMIGNKRAPGYQWLGDHI